MLTLDALTQRWDAMVAALQAHPDVTLVFADRGRPGGDDWIADAHSMWGLPADDAFDTFYRFADGLRLRWTIEHEGCALVGGDVRFTRLEELDGPEFWPVSSDTFEQPVEVQGTRLNPVLPAHFTEWSEDSLDAALLVPGGPEVRVATTRDHCADVGSAALIGFGDYIDLMFRGFMSRHISSALTVARRRAPLARDAAPSLVEARYELDALVALTRSEPNLGQAAAFFAKELG